MPPIVRTVGQVFINGVIQNLTCSGTVVSRDHVLTAAHCICGSLGGVSSVTFHLPQDGGYNYNADHWVVHPEWRNLCNTQFSGGPRAADLAVLTLESEIPEDVVETPAALSLDPITAANDGLGALVVGFGGTESNDSDKGAGWRRHGWTGPPVVLKKDPCGFMEQNHCNDDWEWELVISYGAYTAKGDSGGPLIKLMGGTEFNTVVGVTSGYYQDAFLGNKSDAVSVWAPTGSGTGTSPDNATFLMQALGGDADGDGVPEANDNCPASFCTDKGVPVRNCKNPLQLDTDNDGWGDEYCDNCKPETCLQLNMVPTEIACHNPSQSNRDGDDWGDRCDTCPSWQVPLTDSDGDHVGDACDNCNGTMNPTATCDQDGGCVLPGQWDVCLTEEMPDGNMEGRCLGQTDMDGDGLGEECDTCPDIPTLLGEVNSNGIAEDSAGVQPLADVCDRVPLALLAPQRVEVLKLQDLPLKQGDGRDVDDLVRISGGSFLGRVSKSTAGSPIRFDDHVRFMHCNCVSPMGRKLALEECVGAKKQCSSISPLKNSNWHGISLDVTLPYPGTISPGTDTPFTMNFETWDEPAQFGHSYDMTWSWWSDVQTGRVKGYLEDPNLPWDPTNNRSTTHGAILTEVRNLSGVVTSNRDSTYSLRDTYQMFDTPLYKVNGDIQQPKVSWSDRLCGSSGCFEWILPSDFRNPARDPFDTEFSKPLVLFGWDDEVYVAGEAGDYARITDKVSVGIRRALLDEHGSHVWMTPSEAGYRVKRHGMDAIAVMLPLDMSAEVQPNVVTRRGDVLSLSNETVLNVEGSNEQVLRDLAVAGPAESWEQPWGVSDFRAAFSAIEQSVYVVGGELHGAASSRIWRYDLASRTWRNILGSASAAPSSQVLSVAYDQRRAALYVLDVDDEPIAPSPRAPHMARLVRYDTQAQTAMQLAAWPRIGLFQALHLAVADDGHLILVGARKNNWMAWRLQVDGSGIVSAGVREGVGGVLDRPIMGEQELVLPAIRNDRPVYIELDVAGFHGGTQCSVL